MFPAQILFGLQSKDKTESFLNGEKTAPSVNIFLIIIKYNIYNKCYIGRNKDWERGWEFSEGMHLEGRPAMTGASPGVTSTPRVTLITDLFSGKDLLKD